MGTRSLTRVIEDRKTLVCMYRQMDGYPSGHGQELAEFLHGIQMVNGIGKEKPRIANGYSCLAAQLVAHFKTEPGSIYLYPADTEDAGQEYEYEIHGKFGNPPPPPVVKVYSASKRRKKLFEGSPAELMVWIKHEEKQS